ncbi:MAG: hypothetical protein IJC98_04840 [Clostridia bacterium]|nr:hypothetical protein [Clostridia bacterium]
MVKFWGISFAFAFASAVYAICKIAGMQWAAERPWSEVIIYVAISVVLLVCFFMRKKIGAVYQSISAKIAEKTRDEDEVQSSDDK